MDDTAASLDIWLVRVLRTLLVERSVTQTALRLNQTQPAISTALRKLRETLNDPILVRGKSGMVPTEYGASLLASAQRVLREVDFVSTPHGDFDPGRSRRIFRVAAPDYLNDFFMPTVIAQFREAAPHARLEIDSLNPTLDHAAALDAGELDLVIGNWPKPDARFEKSDLFSDTVVCLMRADHPLAQAPMTRETYLAAPHLAPTPYSGGRGGGAVDIGFGAGPRGAAHRDHAPLLRPRAASAAAIGSDLYDDPALCHALREPAAACRGGRADPVSAHQVAIQLWHPQPDRPSDIGWLRTLMSQVSERLVAHKARVKRPPALQTRSKAEHQDA